MNGVKLNRLQWHRITSTYLVTNYIGVNNHVQGNPRQTYTNKATAELPMLERGSSATKPSHAVTNPRISE